MANTKSKNEKWWAVAIGIRRAGHLPELPGAVNGAKNFIEWAEKRYNTKIFTDEIKPVVFQEIRDFFDKLLQKDVERLLIYFGGHGMQRADTPVWLLSNWETDEREAINVNQTMTMARRTGIPRVAIFSDACRNVTGVATELSPASLIKRLDQPGGLGARKTLCDRFFAARFDEISQEVGAKETAAAYGVFTRCLMDALNGKALEAIELNPAPGLDKAVTSGTLSLYLDRAVREESGATPGAQVQRPDTEALWLPPDNIYYTGPFASSHTVATREFKATSKPASKPDQIVLETVAGANSQDDARVQELEQKIEQAKGRSTFETRQGLSFVDDEAESAVVSGVGEVQRGNIFVEAGLSHVRGPNDDAPRGVAVRLKNGNWFAGCLFPNFVGTVLIENGGAASVTYEPALNGDFRGLFDESLRSEIARWTALMHQGRHANKSELMRTAQMLRQYKHLNPSLGILAAYAYDRASADEEIMSIGGYFAFSGQQVPFDVALLLRRTIQKSANGALQIETVLPVEIPGVGGQTKIAQVAGTFPLMTRGWSLLELESEAISARLIDLRKHLVRSLWTTLTPQGGILMAQLLRNGEL